MNDRDRLVAAATAWRDEDPDPVTVAEVDDLLAAGDVEALRAHFGARLQFGTAGLRGPVGAGPNRMNRALVRRASAGVAAWLRDQGLTGPVVVARDARHGSAAFAAEAAAAFAGAGHRVLVLPRPLPTPVAAFAVRHLDAVAGVVITASHNPPQDNGYKLYLGDGAQIVPPADAEISAAIDAIGPLADVLIGSSGIEELGEEVIDAYVAGAVALTGPVEQADPPLVSVYTPLHGVGASTVHAAFAALGAAPPHDVVAQVEPDPTFPTVTFPNPEEPGALDLALEQATALGADLVLANDPDADRLAVAVPDVDAGGWRVLTGDELGALLADHVLRQGPLDSSDVVVTTVVSSRLLSKLAAAAGVAYAEALTGFKWVVRAPQPGQRFRFGYEEALGYCIGELVRDKDGITAALAVHQLATALKRDGLTVTDRLDDLFRDHGVHVTRQRSLRLDGLDWLARVTAAMASLREEPPPAIADRRVLELEDLLDGTRLPASDVLIWTMDGARLVVRPSGTEPKVKCYAEVVAGVPEGADVRSVAEAASTAVDSVLDAAERLLAEHGV